MHGLAMALLVCSCAEPKPLPHVVRREPGKPGPISIPGPMPHFGPFATVNDAIGAACPFILSQPGAIIPVRKDDESFDEYWRTAQEYCAWIYGVESKAVEMSLLAVSASQSNPNERYCDLPPYVADDRYPADSISYLVVVHNHPYDEKLSNKELRFLVEMANLHGYTAPLNGRNLSISIVAYVGQERAGKVTCTGYYRYFPARNGDLVKVALDSRSGEWKEARLGRIRWDLHGIPRLEP